MSEPGAVVGQAVGRGAVGEVLEPAVVLEDRRRSSACSGTKRGQTLIMVWKFMRVELLVHGGGIGPVAGSMSIWPISV